MGFGIRLSIWNNNNTHPSFSTSAHSHSGAVWCVWRLPLSLMYPDQNFYLFHPQHRTRVCLSRKANNERMLFVLSGKQSRR